MGMNPWLYFFFFFAAKCVAESQAICMEFMKVEKVIHKNTDGMFTKVLQAEKTNQYLEQMPMPVKTIVALLLWKGCGVVGSWIVSLPPQMVP